MPRRGLYVIAILAIWGATLGWHVKRLYFRPAAELLAEAARTIPPGTAYYVVKRDGQRIGWAQTDVDTLPGQTGFLLRDRLILGTGLMPGLDPLRVTMEATLGQTFTLRGFRLDAQGLPGIREVRGDVHGDTVLDLAFRGDGPARNQTIALEEPILVAAAWPLRFAAQREVTLGETFELGVYDPLTGTKRPVTLTVLEERVRTFPDSVAAEDGMWISAREDTVRAWRVEHDVSGIKLEAWVDEDGRLLEASIPGSLRLERTAFELAYFGDAVPERLPGRPAADAGQPKDGRPNEDDR